MKLRTELLGLLSSIHSCLDMYKNIKDDIENLTAKKIKIFHKAVSITLQQVDRLIQMFNKVVEKAKINKFIFRGELRESLQ